MTLSEQKETASHLSHGFDICRKGPVLLWAPFLERSRAGEDRKKLYKRPLASQLPVWSFPLCLLHTNTGGICEKNGQISNYPTPETSGFDYNRADLDHLICLENTACIYTQADSLPGEPPGKPCIYTHIHTKIYFLKITNCSILYTLLCCCCLVTKSYLTLLCAHGLYPSSLLCQWDFPGNIRVGCHFLL